MPAKLETGAGNETRTRDPFLGKEALYQLSYTRIPGGPKRIRTAVNREKAGCPSPLDDGVINHSQSPFGLYLAARRGIEPLNTS
jgi:hypothetical protein